MLQAVAGADMPAAAPPYLVLVDWLLEGRSYAGDIQKAIMVSIPYIALALKVWLVWPGEGRGVPRWGCGPALCKKRGDLTFTLQGVACQRVTPPPRMEKDSALT